MRDRRLESGRTSKNDAHLHERCFFDNAWTFGDTIRIARTDLDECCQAGFSDCGIWFDYVDVCGENIRPLVVGSTNETSERSELTTDTKVVSLPNGIHP
jgi:hypothetical protein